MSAGVPGDPPSAPDPQDGITESEAGYLGSRSATRRTGWLSPVSAAVFIVLAMVVSVAAWTARSVDQGSDRRLLEQRASEAVALFGTTGVRIETSLRSLAAVSRATGTDSERFAEFADQEIAGGHFVALAAVVGDGDEYRVSAVASDPDAAFSAAGDQLDPRRADAVARAVAADGRMTSTGVFEVAGDRRFGFAIADGGFVAYGEARLSAPTQSSTSSFRDVDVAVYASAEARPDQVVQATTSLLPLGSGSIERPLVVGAERWTLVVRARTSLAGGLSHVLPLILLVSGLLTAAAAALTVEVLARRRLYALTLVRERTTSLRESLLELDAARDELASHLVLEQEANRELTQVSHMKSVLLASG